MQSDSFSKIYIIFNTSLINFKLNGVPFFKEYYGNPSSIHQAGRNVKSAIELSRKKIAECLNSKSSNIKSSILSTFFLYLAWLECPRRRRRYVYGPADLFKAAAW